ncbi:protein TPR3-like [Carex rostrata]
MSSQKRETVYQVLQFLDEEDFKGAMHKLEQESGYYFNMKYFKEEVQNGNWDDVEKYLRGFIKIEDKTEDSLKIFYTINKEKYLEALDKEDRAKAVEILNKDLKVFSSAEDLRNDTELLTVENFRENRALYGYKDCKWERENMLAQLDMLIKLHPLLRDKLEFPTMKSSTLVSLINQSNNCNNHECKNTSLIPKNNTRGQPSGAHGDEFTEINQPAQCITEISQPAQCHSLNLTENLGNDKISGLVYANSGVALLALASNAYHLLWEWPGNKPNSRGQATTSVSPQLWKPPKGILMANDVKGRNHEDAVHCFALSKEDDHVVSASGGKVTLFNASTFKPLKTLMSPPPAATYLGFHPQKNYRIAVAMEDFTIRIYDITDDKFLEVLENGHSKKITGLAFSGVLNILVSSDANAEIQLWNEDTWKKMKKRIAMPMPYSGNPKFGNSATRVQFDRLHVDVLVVHETFIVIFNATKREFIVQWLLPHENDAPVTYATYSCDSQLVYATFKDATVCIFDAEKLKIICRILPSSYVPRNLSANVHQSVIAVHPSKPNQFAIGLTDGGVYVLEPVESEATWVAAPPDQA